MEENDMAVITISKENIERTVRQVVRIIKQFTK